jgi:hypothetical protein
VSEERARALAGGAAILAAAAAVAGAATVPLFRERGGAWGVGFLLAVGGLLAGVAVLVHGARHAHERGRAFAVLAAFVGLLAVLIAGYGALTRPCTGRGPSRCVEFGFEEDR